MKLDPTEVLAMVDRLREPGFAGEDGDRRRSEFATARLTEIGWGVEPIGASAPESPVPLGRGSVGWIARRSSADRPPCRVVLQAALAGEQSDETAGKLTSVFRSLRRGTPAPPQSRPLAAADLSGLALLLELARSWPKTWSRRMEVVVAGTVGHAGCQSLARLLGPADDGLPTLLLSLIAPGVGRELTVVGEPHRDLAIACAKSLWVPVSEGGAARELRRFWPTTAIRAFPEHVALIGAGPTTEAAAGLDPLAVQRVSQLVAEICLRWAKARADHRSDVGDFRSDSRSSQNPG